MKGRPQREKLHVELLQYGQLILWWEAGVSGQGPTESDHLGGVVGRPVEGVREVVEEAVAGKEALISEDGVHGSG